MLISNLHPCSLEHNLVNRSIAFSTNLLSPRRLLHPRTISKAMRIVSTVLASSFFLSRLASAGLHLFVDEDAINDKRRIVDGIFEAVTASLPIDGVIFVCSNCLAIDSRSSDRLGSSSKMLPYLDKTSSVFSSRDSHCSMCACRVFGSGVCSDA